MLFQQADDDRLRDAQQTGVRGIQVLGHGFGDGGEDTADRTQSSACENAVQLSARFMAPYAGRAGFARRLPMLEVLTIARGWRR
jgi:hypothetical protein